MFQAVLNIDPIKCSVSMITSHSRGFSHCMAMLVPDKRGRICFVSLQYTLKFLRKTNNYCMQLKADRGKKVFLWRRTTKQWKRTELKGAGHVKVSQSTSADIQFTSFLSRQSSPLKLMVLHTQGAIKCNVTEKIHSRHLVYCISSWYLK